jgi:PQQ system protein
MVLTLTHRVLSRNGMYVNLSRIQNMNKATIHFITAVTTATVVAGCNYAGLLRPSVLSQLTPEMVNLINELPNVDHPNERTIERLFAHGGLEHAKLGDDGVYRTSIEVPDGEFIWKPAMIVMENGGELELEFNNSDTFSHHAALLPSNGNPVTVPFAPGERGHARVRLDGPGLYWFGCPVGNHAGRGMLGLIVVGGEVPDEAKLDRPKQTRP